MSLNTWKAKYYRVAVGSIPKEKAIAHSLRKWLGLREKNLKKHGLVRSSSGREIKETRSLSEISCLSIDAETCALCKYYYTDDNRGKCFECPLKLYLHRPCDRSNVHESEYGRWKIHGDPIPMIKALVAIWRKERCSR